MRTPMVVALLTSLVLVGSAPAQDTDEGDDVIPVPRSLVRRLAADALAVRAFAAQMKRERDEAVETMNVCWDGRRS